MVDIFFSLDSYIQTATLGALKGRKYYPLTPPRCRWLPAVYQPTHPEDTTVQRTVVSYVPTGCLSCAGVFVETSVAFIALPHYYQHGT